MDKSDTYKAFISDISFFIQEFFQTKHLKKIFVNG